MTGPGFRDWLRRRDLSRLALLDALHRLGWTDLKLRALDKWRRDGPPQHAVVVLGFMERHPGDWDIQRTPGTNSDHAYVGGDSARDP